MIFSYLNSFLELPLWISGDRIVFSESVFALLIIFDCCSPSKDCSFACFFFINTNSLSCLCFNLQKFLCSRKYSNVIGGIISVGVLGFIDDDARLLVSAVEFVLTDVLLAPVVVMIDLVSNEGVDAEAESVIRARRTDELIDMKPPSDEFVTEEFNNSSVFLINNGLFN